MTQDITESSTYSEQLEFLGDQIDTPKRVSVDGVDVTNRSANELIELARFKRSSSIMGYGLGACIIQQSRPPNAIGTQRGV